MENQKVSYLEKWVEARATQQHHEDNIKRIKDELTEIEYLAQREAVSKLAELNNVTDTNLSSLLDNLKTKTFKFSPLFKIQVSTTNQVVPNEDLTSLRESLKAEKERLEIKNKSRIDILKAERLLIDEKINGLQTNSKIAQLEHKIETLTKQLTVKVVKCLSLKKNK